MKILFWTLSILAILWWAFLAFWGGIFTFLSRDFIIIAISLPFLITGICVIWYSTRYLIGKTWNRIIDRIEWVISIFTGILVLVSLMFMFFFHR